MENKINKDNEKEIQKLKDINQKINDVKNTEDLVINEEENKKSTPDNNRKLPEWYQELSHEQRMFIELLQSVIICDIEEGIAARTSRVIAKIGILPRATHSQIKEALKMSDKNPVTFLLHLYKFIRSEDYIIHCTGKTRDYFTVNERLILSGVAYLSYYWTVLDLERRIFRSQSQEKIVDIQHMVCTAYKSTRKKKKKHYSSPYLEHHPFLSLVRTRRKKSSKYDMQREDITKHGQKTQASEKVGLLCTTNQTEKKEDAYLPWQLVKLVNGVASYSEYWKQFYGKYRHTEKSSDTPDSMNMVEKIDGSKQNLTEQVKYQLQLMADEGNPLAALPQVHTVPCIRMWIKYREGFRLTKEVKDKFLRLSSLECSSLQFHPCRVYMHNPFKFDKGQMVTWKNIYSIRKKAEKITHKYQSEVRTAQVDDARHYWLPMYAEYFPSSRFLDIFYAYLPSKEEDVLVNPGI